MCLLMCACKFNVKAFVGVGCHWWFNYPGPLLDAEKEIFKFVVLPYFDLGLTVPMCVHVCACVCNCLAMCGCLQVGCEGINYTYLAAC